MKTSKPSKSKFILAGILCTFMLGGLLLFFSEKTCKATTDALQKIMSLGGYTYRWNQQGKLLGLQDVPQVGVIAEELQKVLPEAVHPDPQTGYNTVEYHKIIPLLIQAIKELKQEKDREILMLEDRIAVLELKKE